MARFIIPTKKEFKNLSGFENVTWDEIYGKWICDTCGKNLKEGESYIIIGKNEFRHTRCDPDYN